MIEGQTEAIAIISLTLFLKKGGDNYPKFNSG